MTTAGFLEVVAHGRATKEGIVESQDELARLRRAHTGCDSEQGR